jgi:hypothetical protein
MKTILLALALTSSTSLLATVKARLLNPTLVLATNQGLLNDHIIKKIDQKKNNLKFKKDQYELCFVEVTKSESSLPELHVYEQACPSQFDTNKMMSQSLSDSSQDFLDAHKEKLLQVFELGPLVKTEAISEFENLKKEYKDVWQKFVSAEQEESYRQKLSKDALGRFIFMSLGGTSKKKMNIGYVDQEGLIRGLCSEAWSNLCLFLPSESTLKKGGADDPKSLYKGLNLKAGFKAKFLPGGEEVIYENSEGGIFAESLPNWRYNRKVTVFTDVLAAEIFSRGNDDSRAQGYFYIKHKGNDIPISEEWYKFFKSRSELASLAFRDPNLKRSHRTKSEWNYLTAIHPLQLLKLSNGKFRLHIAAFVIYSGNIVIDEENCDISETGGYELLPIDKIKDYKMPYPKYQVADNELGFSPFMAKLLHGEHHGRKLIYGDELDEEELFSKPMPDFRKIYHASYENKTKDNDNKVVPKDTPYIPGYIFAIRKDGGVSKLSEIRQKKNKVRFYSLDLFYDLDEVEENEWVILKGANSYEDTGNYYKFKQELGLSESSINLYLKNFKSNMLKEYVSLKQNDQDQFYFELRGFNPNESFMNNSKTFTSLSKEKLNYDPAAVYSIWSSLNPLKVGQTQIEERDNAELLIDLKKKLSRSYYNLDADSMIAYGSTEKVASELEAGKTISLKNTESFLNDLSENKRIVGENRYTNYWRKGHVDNIEAFVQSFSMYSSSISFEDESQFPKVFYFMNPFAGGEDKQEMKKISLSDSERKMIFSYGKTYWEAERKGQSGFLEILKKEEDTLVKIFSGEKPFSDFFARQKFIIELKDKAHPLMGYDSFYFTFRRTVQEFLVNLGKLDSSKKKSVEKILKSDGNIVKILGKDLSDTKLSNFTKKWNALKDEKEFQKFYEEHTKFLQSFQEISDSYLQPSEG